MAPAQTYKNLPLASRFEVHFRGTPVGWRLQKACISRRFRKMSESPTLSAKNRKGPALGPFSIFGGVWTERFLDAAAQPRVNSARAPEIMESPIHAAATCAPWNKGKLVDQEAPLELK